MEKLLAGECIKLPFKLGKVAVLGIKQKVRYNEDGEVRGLSTDWKETRALWKRDPKAGKEGKLIYHTNDHSDNIRYKYFWWPFNGSFLLNKTAYSLVMSRGNKRKLKPKVLEGVEFHLWDKEKKND